MHGAAVPSPYLAIWTRHRLLPLTPQFFFFPGLPDDVGAYNSPGQVAVDRHGHQHCLRRRYVRSEELPPPSPARQLPPFSATQVSALVAGSRQGYAGVLRREEDDNPCMHAISAGPACQRGRPRRAALNAATRASVAPAGPPNG
jgi:hypothetical protein